MKDSKDRGKNELINSFFPLIFYKSIIFYKSFSLIVILPINRSKKSLYSNKIGVSNSKNRLNRGKEIFYRQGINSSQEKGNKVKQSKEEGRDGYL